MNRPGKVFRSFAKQKKEFLNLLAKMLSKQNEKAIAHLIPPENTHTYEHGLRLSFKDVDQNKESGELIGHEATAEYSVKKLRSGDFTVVSDFIRDMTTQMTSLVKKTIFRRMEEITDKAGTTLDAKGQPLSAELVLSAYERISLSVDKDGTISVPQWVMHPDLAPKAEEIWGDPNFQRRFQEIIQKKAQQALIEEQERISKYPKFRGQK